MKDGKLVYRNFGSAEVGADRGCMWSAIRVLFLETIAYCDFFVHLTMCL